MKIKSLLSLLPFVSAALALPAVSTSADTHTFVSQTTANHSLTFKQPKICDDTVVQVHKKKRPETRRSFNYRLFLKIVISNFFFKLVLGIFGCWYR